MMGIFLSEQVGDLERVRENFKKIGEALKNKTSGIWAGTGTPFTSYTKGDLIFANDTNKLARLPIGTEGKVLKSVGGVPVWAIIPSSPWQILESNIFFNEGNVGLGPEQPLYPLEIRKSASTLGLGLTTLEKAVSNGQSFNSPYLLFQAAGWSTALSSNQDVIVRIGLKTNSSTNTNVGDIVFEKSVNGGIYSPFFTIGTFSIDTHGKSVTMNDFTAKGPSTILGYGLKCVVNTVNFKSYEGLILTSNNFNDSYYSLAFSPSFTMRGHVSNSGVKNVIEFSNEIRPFQTPSIGGVWCLSSKIHNNQITDLLFVVDDGRMGLASLPHMSAKLDVTSTTKGALLPRMTTSQKNAIATPAEGLEVYDTTLKKKCFYNGTAWETITSS